MGVVDWFRPRGGRRRDATPAAAHALPADRVPYHVGIIMDGNGRWATRRHLPVAAGHRAGTKALKRTVQAARRLGISQLTVYSFSTENWSRSADEVDTLMQILSETIRDEVPELREQGVRIRFIGRREELTAELREQMAWAEAQTGENDVLTLFVAFNYGGRTEIADAVRRALADGVTPEQLDEEHIARYLYAPEMREPDLLVRTSGESRLSNFLLWESAYSELYFADVLWPDFDEAELALAVQDYAGRERRFGAR
jgi:undecaprenyl diphosphate synthase